MRSAIRLFACTGGLLLLSPLAAVGGNTNTHSKFAGVYMSSNLTKSGAFMNLSLGPDGSATLPLMPRRVSRKNRRWRFNPATMECRQ